MNELAQRLPESKVIIFSVFPRKPDTANERVKAVNAMLPQLADGKRIEHRDLSRWFLSEKGQLNQTLYKSDLLHLNDRGYRVWATALQPLLERHGLPVNPIFRVTSFGSGSSQPNEGTFLFDVLGHSAKSGSDHGNGLVALPLSFSPLPKGLDRLGHRLSYRSAFGLDLWDFCSYPPTEKLLMKSPRTAAPQVFAPFVMPFSLALLCPHVADHLVGDLSERTTPATSA